jgi:hypothetical protein
MKFIVPILLVLSLITLSVSGILMAVFWFIITKFVETYMEKKMSTEGFYEDNNDLLSYNKKYYFNIIIQEFMAGDIYSNSRKAIIISINSLIRVIKAIREKYKQDRNW